ncbi:hypothetical protein BHF71_09985 [Vulcanibacillus modesticaldus]|uniref:Recombinase domain-containing protein n=1 Tax=Vulcanibacillus modesticaldus TaxID=337097 RepID=A0A1D2YTX8_9BACI|nr:recombinase family protein [Vulcanibacillus modesticaldus]OEF99154.1 hypothetical protein BHF71_09985 [Vulcanibacillus modesticaldus]
MRLSDILKPGMRGAFYGRHSTDKQTMAAQLSSAKGLIEKYQCVLVGEYLDEGVSARKKDIDNRKGIKNLLADAYLGKYDFVVVSNHDRLARSPKEHFKIRRTMKEENIPIVISSTESLYDSGDIIVNLIYDGTSKFEIDNTRIRTRDTMRKIAKEGKWAGGVAPYGYRYVAQEGRFEQVEEEIAIVRKIFELYRKNEGFKSIANQLEGGSYRGKDWDKNKVKYVITNPFYAGYISLYRRKENNHQAIIDDRDNWIMEKSDLIDPVISIEDWEACWDLYQRRKKLEIAPKHYHTSFILGGYVYCKKCGSKLKTKDQRTTSRALHPDGTRKVYGDKVYRCLECKYSIKDYQLHEIIEDLLLEIREAKHEELARKLVESLKEDVQGLNDEIKELELTIAENKTNIAKIDREIQSYLSKETDENKAMVNILTVTKKKITNRNEQLRKLINEKLNRIKYKQEVEMNEELLSKKIKEFSVPIDDLNNRDLKRLIDFLVNKIEVFVEEDKDGNLKGYVDIITRHSLKMKKTL